MKIYILAILSVASSQEVSNPSSLLRPRNHNHHSFDANQYINNLIKPTRQGPVLFPNDAPPPPRPPLIVTSRPLVESIARSELGANNTETSQSQVNRQVSFVPFLTRLNEYRPYNPSPSFDYNFLPTQVPYAEVVKKSRLNSLERDNRYNDYEEETSLPPIYKALSDHANQNVLKFKQKKQNHNFKAPAQVSLQNYQNLEDGNSEYDENQNYAFSYRVNDRKTGDDFSHSQQSSGSATNGEYRVRLPDGRMQIVSYTADENGYKADVRYDETHGNTIDQHAYNDYGKNNDYGKHNDYGVKHNYQPDKVNYKQRQDYVLKNDYRKDNDYGLNKHEYADRNVITTGNNYGNNFDGNANVASNDVKNGVDYIDRSNGQYILEKKEKPVVETDYYYPDVSKEYYNDYSSEYNGNTEPHKSKFSTLINNANVDVTNTGIASTVKPSYEELKPLFVTKSAYNYDTSQYKATTPSYDGTTENVVVIKPNLYTNIRNSIPSGNLLSYATPKVIVATTPSSYLVSTISNLKNKVHLATKPILSDRFIDKINKYLSFN